LKVIFYNHTGQVSGAERVMLMILSGLDRAGFQASVICPAEGELTRHLEGLGLSVNNIELLEARFTWRPDYLVKYLKSFLRVILELRRLLIEAKPDLIHANTIRAGLVATTATFGTRMPVVWHLHDILPHHPLSTLIRWFAALSPRTSLLAISQAVANRFQGGVLRLLDDCTKIRVIHNGVNLKRFSSDPAASQRIRQELGVSEDQFLMGIVGQITPRKGQFELILAFAKVAKQLPKAVLTVVGAPLFNNDHEYLEKLKRTAENLGVVDRVIFTGARNDVQVVMQALDLLVLNSNVEPFGLVVIEAMACGIPVLATDVDGVPELIRHGVSGWLVPAGDKQQLTQGLVTLATDRKLRSCLAGEAKNNTVPKFSAEKYLQMVENYYLRICSSSPEKVRQGGSVEQALACSTERTD
jgi:glycosyltransferase involved in cell wall biosynthesis